MDAKHGCVAWMRYCMDAAGADILAYARAPDGDTPGPAGARAPSCAQSQPSRLRVWSRIYAPSDELELEEEGVAARGLQALRAHFLHNGAPWMWAEGPALSWTDHCQRHQVRAGWDRSLMCILELA